MIRLKTVKIFHYKSFETTQSVDIDPEITVLVGMNESGKTSILEAIAKTNYFHNDENFEFNLTHDYPRREKKQVDKQGINPKAVACTYLLDDETLSEIQKDLGEKVFAAGEITKITHFDNHSTISGVDADRQAFAAYQTKNLGISSKALNDKLAEVTNKAEFEKLLSGYAEDGHADKLKKIAKYYPERNSNWSCPIEHYIWTNHLSQRLPKFLYYDEYYALPSRIDIESLRTCTRSIVSLGSVGGA